MSSTVITRKGLVLSLRDKIQDEIIRDECSGFSTARIEVASRAFVCDVLEVGDNFLTVSEGGNLRHINMAAIYSFQLVSGNPDFLPPTPVPVTGTIGD